jgi:hypothetical protein
MGSVCYDNRIGSRSVGWGGGGHKWRVYGVIRIPAKGKKLNLLR